MALNGLLDPEAGQTVLAALQTLARPANADDPRSASLSVGLMPWSSWPAAAWRAGAAPERWGPTRTCW